MDFGAAGQAARWRFGACELDEFRLELLRDGSAVALEAKALELLRVFVRHPGEVLTRDELLETVWPGRVLSESVLTRAVSLLRRAIGDTAQVVLRTVHRYGYRFDAEVERLTPPKTQSPPALGLAAGMRPPQRENWQLIERLGEGRNETWLAEHDKTRERRVFKFAADGVGLSTLKREITLHRLLMEALPQRADWVAVLDWNLQEAPYFLETEHCPGGSLERWLGEHPQTALAARLELVAQAAEALAAAHAVGLLHKDVKPANLLVAERDGRPRILLADFGSGLLLDDTRLQALAITRLGLSRAAGDAADSDSGTLLYLAPEILAGQPATLKTDVYALGVLLYQLAVGDLRRPLAPGWERDIDDELLREDIAAAADLDPARRLPEAAQLAQRLRGLDLRRLRRQAERESAARVEQQRRQMERWRARRGWMLAAYALLAAGLAGSTLLYLQARSARDAARRAEAEAVAINGFLQHDLLLAADPRESGRSDVSVREVVEAAAARSSERFRGQPRLEAQLRSSLGAVFSGLALFEQSAQQFRAAIALLQPQAGDPGLLLDARIQLADALAQLERLAEAQAEYRAAAALAERHGLDQRAVEVRIYLAELERPLGRAQQGLEQMDALRAAVQRLDPTSEISLRYARIRADLLDEVGSADAVDAYREALLRFEQALGREHAETMDLRRTLGGRLAVRGRDQEALAILEPLHADMQRVFGPAHQETLTTINELALALQHLGEVDRAIALQEFASRELVSRYGELHAGGLQHRANLASLYAQRGEHERALALYRQVHAAQVQSLGESRRETLTTAHNIGRSLQDLQRWQEAIAIQRRTAALAHESLSDGHYIPWAIDASLAHSLGMVGAYPEANALMERAVERLEALVGPDHRLTQRAHGYRKELRARMGEQGDTG